MGEYSDDQNGLIQQDAVSSSTDFSTLNLDEESDHNDSLLDTQIAQESTTDSDGLYGGSNDLFLITQTENNSGSYADHADDHDHDDHHEFDAEALGLHSVMLNQGESNYYDLDHHHDDAGGSGEAIAADAIVGGVNGKDALDSGYVWANDQSGITLDYNFYTSLPGFYAGMDAEYNTGFQAMNANQAAASRQVLQVIEQYVNITFNEVGAGDASELSFGQVSRSNVNVVAHAFYPTGAAASGDIYLNTSFWGYDTNPQPGDIVYETLFHEVGHALGLKHSFDAGGGSGDVLSGAEDNNTFSVMSYTTFGGNATTMMIYDIAALQEMYGVNTTYNTGNNTYTLASGNHYTIWDAGGTDTLDGSAQGGNITINLQEGTHSSVGNIRTGIAYGATIENATGGAGDDTIYGNNANNVILGGNGADTIYGSAGSDTIDGQVGSDTANYAYSVNAFAFNFINSVTVAFEHIADMWTDTLSNIENFIFTDGTYTFAQLEAAFNTFTNDFAPTVDGDDLTLEVGATSFASDVITAADADNNPLTYEVWDGGKQNYTGYFDLNGTKLTAGRGHTLTQEQFDDLIIVGGSANSTDTLWVRVSDGSNQTAWESFTLTTQAGSGQGHINTAPNVTQNNVTLGQGATALATASIASNDIDGDTLTYKVWDGGTGNESGYFDLNGTRLTANTSHTLTQAQFDALQIVGGADAGTETMWVMASDGNADTGWLAFTLTTDAAAGGGGNNAPTVVGNDLTLDADGSVLASSTITVNDADGDVLTYQIWDGGGAGSSGYFELNGVEFASKRTHNLSQADFDSLRIVGGDQSGAETLWVRVSDGTEQTAWETFTLTTTPGSGLGVGGGGGGGNSAPVITANNSSLEIGTTVLASSLIGVVDGDGDTLTYKVWDSGKAGGSGYFELNGQKLAHSQTHNLTQAQFDSLNIVAGDAEGTDKLWVRVNDGTVETDWHSFILTTTAPAAYEVSQDSVIAEDIITSEQDDDIAMALAEMSQSEGTGSEADVYGGDVYTGLGGFEENTDNGALI